MTTLSLHAFSDHEHTVCHSKVEKHIHKKDFDCKLDVLRQHTSILAINNFNLGLNVTIHTTPNLQYNFLKNHFQLSFSLRGPPVYI
jgi:hypothetical protein